MKHPTPGLRPLRYMATSPAKVQLVIQPDDRLEVSEDVEAQLRVQSPQFKNEGEAAKLDERDAERDAGKEEKPAKKAPAKKTAAKKAAKAE